MEEEVRYEKNDEFTMKAGFSGEYQNVGQAYVNDMSYLGIVVFK